jgi:hypothetical protein
MDPLIHPAARREIPKFLRQALLNLGSIALVTRFWPENRQIRAQYRNLRLLVLHGRPALMRKHVKRLTWAWIVRSAVGVVIAQHEARQREQDQLDYLRELGVREFTSVQVFHARPPRAPTH